MRLSNLPIFRWHTAQIHVPRVERLSRAITELSPDGVRSMLDVGCGDGTLARDVARRIGAEELVGVDVKVRDEVAIDVKQYDGRVLPFPNATFDLVTIADVLHHAESPEAVVGEAMRVLRPGGALIIKDHFRFGPVSNATLLAMDIVGNYAAGVLVRGKYLSPPEWVALIAKAQGRVDELVWPFEVHSLPWRIVTRSEYQFLMRVRPVA
ncbi:methyltransferase domain-containing protein [Pendulispora brunnea]|uniref:Methyltransferase domain-containing protein n=1 Tax=Pendulispora brunnea TaxID=2905690 RepID=A0ABZ2K8S0_9BACT